MLGIFTIGLQFLSGMLAPKPKTPKVKPGKLEIPNTNAGEPVPYVFGTVLLKSPIHHWSGGQRAIRVRKKGGKGK